MFIKTMTNRMKAAAVAAVLCLSAAATSIYAMTASLDVDAITVNESIAVDEKYVGNVADLGVSDLESITFTCTAEKTGTFSYGGGISTSVAPEYWEELPEGSVSITAGGTFTVTFDVSDITVSPTGTYQFRNYWSEGGTITIVSVEANGSSSTTDPTDPTDDSGSSSGSAITDGSTSQNAKSGTWSFVDNGDGTGTMTATQARQTDCDWVLTAGYDEDTYAEEGVVPVEGVDPINSHKFYYGTEFGLTNVGKVKNATGVMIESLEVTLTSDVPVKRFMYGGGMNVQNGSHADTESAKAAAGVKDETAGYWYNDMGTDTYDDCIAAGVEFGIDPGFGYDITASETTPLGEYFNVIWDVPEAVYPYQDSGSLSFQFWYGEEDVEEDYQALETVNLIGGILTYTEEKTFDYTDHIEATVGTELNAGDMGGIKISDLGLGANDTVQAVVFTVNTTMDLDKLVYAVGASVGEGWQQWSDTEGGDSWNYVITDTESGAVEIAWIVPDGVDINEEYGEIKLGYWYGGMGETELASVTLESVDVYYYEEEVETTEPTTEAPTETETETEALEATLYGDVDVNGKVEIIDVITLSQCLMGAESLTPQGAKNADVDVNDVINSTDTLNIMKYLVKLIDSLPV